MDTAARPVALPIGTVSFLFTDIEGSTQLIQSHAADYPQALSDHRRLIASAVEQRGGSVFGTEGDAVFAAFSDAGGAVSAAVEAQRLLARARWPDGIEIKVRIGIHTGEAAVVDRDYVGLALHQAARIAAAAHGGQILLSDATRALVAGSLPDGVSVRSLGEHRLKDLAAPALLFQLEAPGLAGSFPPPRTLSSRPNNLPVQLTSFVGREQLREARALLERTRLLTLTGPGGTGKTRFSLQLGAEALDDFGDGVFFVPLDSVFEPELLPSAIVTALDLPPSSAPPLDRLLAHVRDRKLLLILDNFEQIVAAAPAVGGLLRAASGLKTIVTSRVALRVSGEQEYAVPTFGLPSPAAGFAEVAQAEAVQLFVERAMAVQPSFRLTSENASAVADIVVRVDGLPLAIELAAARMRTLSVEALRGRLDNRLGTLSGGARDVPQRQQTLRAAIDWSYELLDPDERQLFARFAVFSGGGYLSEIEAVCGSDGSAPDVLDGLDSLAEKSLVRTVPESQEPRFAMLATIREYGLERLHMLAEEQSLRGLHARTFMRVIEEAAPHLTARDSKAWLDRLEHDHDNVRAALDWALSSGDAEIALRIVASFWRFWQIRGHLVEGASRTAAALALPAAPDQPAALIARAEGAAGSIEYWRGDFEAARRHYTVALDAAHRCREMGVLAEAFYNAGFASLERAEDGHWKLDASPYHEALGLYTALGDRRGVANANWALGIAASYDADVEHAREYYGRALAAYRLLDDPFGTAWAQHELGLLALFDGDHDTAEGYLAEALRTFGSARDLSGVNVLLYDFLELAQRRGERGRAARLAGAATTLRKQTGVDLMTSSAEAIGLAIPTQPDADLAGAWAEGEAMTVDEAVGYALNDPPQTPDR